MNWLNDLFTQKISKEAEQTDATQEFQKKVKASDWLQGSMNLDIDQVEKEYNANLEAEAKILGKTAAYSSFDTVEETLKKDYEKSVKILSDYALAEILMDIRGHKAQNLPEMATELKEAAKKDVAASREKCEKEVLEHVGMSAQVDWKKAFEKYSKEVKPEEPKEKDLYQPKLDKIDEKEWATGKKDDKDFIISDKEKVTQAGAGNGREEKERTDVTKQPGEPQEKKASIKVDAFLVRDPDTELTVGSKITLARSIMSKEGTILEAGGDYEITGTEGERYIITANGKSYTACRFDTPKFFVTAELQAEVNKEAASNMEVINAFVSDSFPKHKGAGVGSANLHVVRYPHGWALVNYSTPIAYRPNGGELFLNSDKYSTTTSAIQNAIRQAAGGSVKEIDEAGLMTAISDASLAAQASLKVEADKGNQALPEGKETAGDKPSEAVDGTTLPADKKEVGDKADRVEEKNSFDKGNDVETIESVNKKASEKCPHCPHAINEHHTGCEAKGCRCEMTPHLIKNYKPSEKEAHCGTCPGDPGVKATAEMCPVCGGMGEDLKNNQRDHMSCMACGITYGESEPMIQSHASKADVIKKIAEVSSPWEVVTDPVTGVESIARVEKATNTKESEEDLEKELQK